MSAEVEYLDLRDVLAIAVAVLGDPAPVRDLGLLGSAVARPQTSLFGEDAYSDIWHKATAMLQSLVGDHALVDGNKRLGWAATAVMLELNGVNATQATNDDVYNLVIAIASGDQQVGSVEQIAARLTEIIPNVESDQGEA